MARKRTIRVLHLYLPPQLWADLEYVTDGSSALNMTEVAREALDFGLALLARRRGLPWPRPEAEVDGLVEQVG